MSYRQQNRSSLSQGFGWGCGLWLGISAAGLLLLAIPVFCLGGVGLIGLTTANPSTSAGTFKTVRPSSASKPNPTQFDPDRLKGM